MAAVLTGAYALIAAGLAFLGVAGFLAYAVRTRTSELAVRHMLGATSHRVVGGLVARMLAPVVGGVAVGLGSAMFLSRFIATLMYEVHTTDPLTYAAVAALVVVAGALACWLPARRAATLDPMEVLRADG